MSKYPREVPLPQLPEFTDEITFDNLGLPVGLDEERIMVHLRALERVCDTAWHDRCEPCG